eukprot:358787-Chlamydomonas_euryale.AAC.1
MPNDSWLCIARPAHKRPAGFVTLHLCQHHPLPPRLLPPPPTPPGSTPSSPPAAWPRRASRRPSSRPPPPSSPPLSCEPRRPAATEAARTLPRQSAQCVGIGKCGRSNRMGGVDTGGAAIGRSSLSTAACTGCEDRSVEGAH